MRRRFVFPAAAAFPAAGFFHRAEQAVGEGGDGEGNAGEGEVTLRIQNSIFKFQLSRKSQKPMRRPIWKTKIEAR